MNRLGSVFVFGFFLTLALASCTDNPTDPDDSGGGPFLGVGANAQGAPGTDPLLEDAYRDVVQGGFKVSALRIPWGEIENRLGNFTWTFVDDHVRQAIEHDLRLSVEVSLIDRDVFGLLPEDLRGQDLTSGNLRVRFSRFVQALEVRGRGRIEYVWVGREVDRYLLASADRETEQAALVSVLEATRDSLDLSESAISLGTSFSAFDLVGSEMAPLFGDVVEASDRVGWSVYGHNADYEQVLSPAETADLAAAAVEIYRAAPVLITEVAFPGGSTTDSAQTEFWERMTNYIASGPSGLEGVFAAWLSDLHQSVASERAALAVPDDKERRDRLESQLRTLGLKEVNGVPTDAWRLVRDWNLSQP